MYQCKVTNCTFYAKTVTLYEAHCQAIHNTGPKYKFFCGVVRCSRTFSTFNAFKSHIQRDHETTTKGNPANNQRRQKNLLPSLLPPLQFTELSCSLCSKTFLTIHQLQSHLRSHFDRNRVTIACPYPQCDKSYNNVSSYGSHLTYKHQSQANEEINFHLADKIIPDIQETTVLDDTSNCYTIDATSTTHDANIETNVSMAETTPDLIRNLALFYMTLTAKHNVAESTSQTIYRQYASLMSLTAEMVIQDLENSLGEHEDYNYISKIVEEVINRKVVEVYGLQGPLNTIHLRRQYFEKSFNYVTPIAYRLGKDIINKECHFHYVPLLQSLAALLADETVYAQYSAPRSIRQDDRLDDIHDGSAMKNHPLFSHDASAIQIVLYQDEFLVANPLGASKKDLKMLGVYYTLGNIHAWNRSKVDPLQLLIMCKSTDLKFFTAKRVFQLLVRDLNLLRTIGIQLRGKQVFGSVAFVAGDNLGNHYLGGFVENFSAAHYFCQYCNICRADFEVGRMAAELRTKTTYDRDVKKISKEREKKGWAESIGNCRGVKNNSIFNDISDFHVIDGMPPCLGHDIFEGVAQFDIPLALTYFERKGWFSREDLNRKIKAFDYSKIGTKDKPTPVSYSEKLGGHAVQTWTLLRILPLLIGSKVKDCTDDVWRMILTLIRIVQIVCSPTTTLDLVAYLNGLIQDYVELRTLNFPHIHLRPKHHYLFHYPRMIMLYGPLMRVWTMRFESKHKYFKDVLRVTRNTKNVTLSLAVKHQYLQASYSIDGLFPKQVAMENATEYHPEMLRPEIIKAIQNFHLSNTENIFIGSKCSYRGVHYKICDLVVLKSEETLNLLQIVTIVLTASEELYFVGKCGKGRLVEDYQVYHVDVTDNMTCCSILDLQDFQPYTVCDDLGFEAITLKHLTS